MSVNFMESGWVGGCSKGKIETKGVEPPCAVFQGRAAGIILSYFLSPYSQLIYFLINFEVPDLS
jgi:hypothetical protein